MLWVTIAFCSLIFIECAKIKRIINIINHSYSILLITLRFLMWEEQVYSCLSDQIARNNSLNRKAIQINNHLTDWVKISIGLCVLSCFHTLGIKNLDIHIIRRGDISSRIVQKSSKYQQTQIHCVPDFNQTNKKWQWFVSLNMWLMSQENFKFISKFCIIISGSHNV